MVIVLSLRRISKNVSHDARNVLSKYPYLSKTHPGYSVVWISFGDVWSVVLFSVNLQDFAS